MNPLKRARDYSFSDEDDDPVRISKRLCVRPDALLYDMESLARKYASKSGLGSVLGENGRLGGIELFQGGGTGAGSVVGKTFPQSSDANGEVSNVCPLYVLI
jgi:hypothetical protein